MNTTKTQTDTAPTAQVEIDAITQTILDYAESGYSS